MSHISYSEIKNWGKCPFYHKLVHIDGLSLFEGNLYTAFGKAVHAACEKVAILNTDELQELFELNFIVETQLLEEPYDHKMSEAMVIEGKRILSCLKEETQDYFGDYEVLSVEERLYEDIDLIEGELSFKGYIDMVIKSGDEIHILDWKTSTKGWNNWKKSDALTKYQLLFYKHYYAQKHSVPLEKIKTHFGVLKRRSNSKKYIEFHEVTSNKEKIIESLNFLKKFMYNVNNKKFVKNRLSCTYCEFNETPHCDKK
tara:strand:- start:4720 stop:5487 length:768 start_codon:yes stop_codon:yes gene_type:complete